MNERTTSANPRGPVPAGRIGLVVVAAALAPLAITKCKPFFAKVADGLVKVGEKLREATKPDSNGHSTAKSQPPVATPTPPVAPVAVKKSAPKPKRKPPAKSKPTKAAATPKPPKKPTAK